MTQKNFVELAGVVGNVRLNEVGGRTYARISLATNHAYRDAEGTPVISTSWHCLTCWEGEHVEGLDSLHKGDRIHVTGRLQYQRYTDESGADRTNAGIMVQTLNRLNLDEPFEMEM